MKQVARIRIYISDDNALDADVEHLALGYHAQAQAVLDPEIGGIWLEVEADE